MFNNMGTLLMVHSVDGISVCDKGKLFNGEDSVWTMYGYAC